MIIKDSSKSVSKPRINIKEFNKFIEELVGVDNLKEIAKKMNLSRSYVSRIEKRALMKLYFAMIE